MLSTFAFLLMRMHTHPSPCTHHSPFKFKDILLSGDHHWRWSRFIHSASRWSFILFQRLDSSLVCCSVLQRSLLLDLFVAKTGSVDASGILFSWWQCSTASALGPLARWRLLRSACSSSRLIFDRTRSTNTTCIRRSYQRSNRV